MPWVISDYESQADLADPVYRDLSRPVGALNDANHARLRSTFDSLRVMCAEIGDPQAAPPPFHYGSHYSSMGVVLFFLIRLEPFTTQQIELQGGRFDHADRLFHSIAETWAHLLEEGNTSDVKELVPEAYYLPDFLRNANGFSLGARQDGTRVDDVVLPPWARGSPAAFVRTMRAALESDHVSARLPRWIDLIFGMAQQGEAAEAALNVFYHLTYEGAVDVASLVRGRAGRATGPPPSAAPLPRHRRDKHPSHPLLMLPDPAISRCTGWPRARGCLGTDPRVWADAVAALCGGAPAARPRRAAAAPSAQAAAGAEASEPRCRVQVAAAGVALLRLWFVGAGARLAVLDSSLSIQQLGVHRLAGNATAGGATEARPQPTPPPTSAARTRRRRRSANSLCACPACSYGGALRRRWLSPSAPPWARTATGCCRVVVGVAGSSCTRGWPAHPPLGPRIRSQPIMRQPRRRRARHRFDVPGTRVTCVTVGQDGCSVLAGCADGSAVLWHPTRRRQRWRQCQRRWRRRRRQRRRRRC